MLNNLRLDRLKRFCLTPHTYRSIQTDRKDSKEFVFVNPPFYRRQYRSGVKPPDVVFLWRLNYFDCLRRAPSIAFASSWNNPFDLTFSLGIRLRISEIAAKITQKIGDSKKVIIKYSVELSYCNQSKFDQAYSPFDQFEHLIAQEYSASLSCRHSLEQDEVQ